MDLERGTLAESGVAYQRQIAAAKRAETQSGIIFLCGYGTDMNGSKATFLAERCAAAGVGFVRFDYRGCGTSAGRFEDGTIGAWRDDALAVFDTLTSGPQIIVGSSMGGWIGLLLAQLRRERIAAFVGIAAAPDFTEELIWKNLTDAQKAHLAAQGSIRDETVPPDQSHPIHATFITEARAHLIFNKPLALPCPVRLLQGMRDREVPWTYAARLADHIDGPDVQLTLNKNSDHRFSSPDDLELLWATVAAFV